MPNDRVRIGENFKKQPTWKVLLGTPFIYIPIIVTVPFVILAAIMVRIHLKYTGATGVKSYWDFVPAWISHRYTYDNQIIYKSKSSWHNWRSYRFFWIFNCKLYCPMSVALFKYMAYLVQIVENWWCPFEHDKKKDYGESAIDSSYWHIYETERAMLHEDDRENPIWNEDAKS